MQCHCILMNITFIKIYNQMTLLWLNTTYLYISPVENAGEVSAYQFQFIYIISKTKI